MKQLQQEDSAAWRHFMSRSGARELAIGLVASGLFGLLAYLSIELTRAEGRFAAVWIPNALAVAWFVRARLKFETCILVMLGLGNIVANVLAGDVLLRAIGLASCNLVEIYLALLLIRRLCGERPDMHDIGDLARFVFASAVIAPMASAVLAGIVLSEGGVVSLALWANWAATDGLGMAIIAPATLVVADAWRNRRLPNRREAIEWTALTVVGTSATIAIFAQTSYPLLFLTAPIVLSHAFRLGALGTAFSVVKVAVIATVCTSLGLGPINLTEHTLASEFVVLQAFIASAFLIGLPVAAVLHGREKLIVELANGRRELSLLADNVTDAVLRYDLGGKCTYASRSVRDVLGETAQTFLGNRASDRAHPDALDRIKVAEARLLSGEADKERFTYRRFLDAADGSPVYIEADCATARNTATGVAEGIVVSARDVTERVELELQLVRAKRHAENAARAKSEFLANMSHEIRTPMNGVLGFTELLMQGKLDDNQKRQTQLILQSGRSMMRLLNDILDLSKIEAGQLAVERDPLDLHEVVEECAALHQTNAANKGLEITVRGQHNCPWVVSDGLRLRQIILNLIGNAVKFTEAGSIVVSYSCDADHFRVIVEDTGIGISADRLERIFRPFEQGEGDTARRFGGTGLGLSISRQLAELLGGALEANSQPASGSRFTLTLPFIEAKQGPLPREEKQALDPASLPKASRILLAEDHDVNRLLVTEMLERCGQEVEIAHDGNEAIQAVLKAHLCGQPYDLVLMDVQMPGCDGYAATRAIRAEGIKANDLPVVALTANAFAEDVAAARDAGMQAHLAKPLVFSELVETLQRWLPTRLVDASWSGESHDQCRDPAAPLVLKKHSPKILTRWHERRREALDAVSDAIRAGDLSGDDGVALARMVHKLAGTAGMFGEEELGERAAAFERALRSETDQTVREELARELLAAA